MNLLNPTLADAYVFMLVFVRVTGMIAFMPIFGSQNIPVQLKVGFCIILTILLLPFIDGREALVMVKDIWPFLFLLVKELLVGMVIGYTAGLLFSILQFGGALVDTLMGFGFVELVDPFTETSTTTLGQLQVLVFTLVFLLLGGHYYMILAVQRSFDVIPLLGVNFHAGAILSELTRITAGVFTSAIQIASPAFVTLIIVQLALGVVARTVPQMNVYFVGIPLTIVLGMGVTIMAFPLLSTVFTKMFHTMMSDIWKLMAIMG